METSEKTLSERAHEIRIERNEGQNTAERVGGLLEDMANAIPDESQLFSGNYEDLKNKPVYSPIITGVEEGAYEIGRINISGYFQSIYGKDTGEGEQGYQRTYYLNVSHSVTPVAPIIGDYQINTDSFVDETHGYTWTYANVNPGANEDTYQISVWFRGAAPISIDGPVRIYDSSKQGSNGEDSEETEWIYFRSNSKIDYNTDGQSVKEALAAYSGTSKIVDSEEFAGQTWYNHPQGIDIDNKYEYKSYRVSSLDANGKRVWGMTGFSTPVLASAYGEKGEDGDGVEYIFYPSNTGTISGTNNYPEQWNDGTIGKDNKTFQDNEFIAFGSAWLDDAVDLKTNPSYGPGSMQFVSIRKKRDGVWQSYSPAKLWSNYARDGVVDGYTVDLSNENMPVGTDVDGNASDYANTSLLQVFYNGTPLSYQQGGGTGYFDYTIGNITRSDGNAATGITASKNQQNGAIVDVAISSVANFDSVNAFIPITVTLPNNTTRLVQITLFGVSVGEPGKSIDLFTSASVIRTDSTGNVATPAKIQMGIRIGENVYYSAHSGGSDSAEGQGFSFKRGYDTNTPTDIDGEITVDTTHGYKSLTIQVYKGNKFIDAETLPFVKDGSNGTDGRGIVSTVPYYRAVASQAEAPSGVNDISTSDARSVAASGWGENLPYLYRRDYTTYSNGSYSFGDTQLDKVWVKGDPGTSGTDGYALIVTPPYAIFEEAEDKTINTSNWSSKVQIVKGSVPQTIGYSDLQLTGVTGTVALGEQGKSLTVTVSGILENIVEGKISFWVTIDNTPFYQVGIPVYVNRVGTYIQTIKGDVETTIMSKTLYDGDGHAVTTFNNLGQYLRSSSENVSALSTIVNGIENSVSEIRQTSEAISLSVNSGWTGYIKKPLAIDAELGELSFESIEEYDYLGSVLEFEHAGGDWQLTYELKDGYNSLSGKTVTWFCIVRFVDFEPNKTTAQICFGSGYESTNSGHQHEAVMVKVIRSGAVNNMTVESGLTNGENNEYAYYDSVPKTSMVSLGGGWYLCATTVTLHANRSIIAGQTAQDYNVGFNSTDGIWEVYYGNIIEGSGYPTLEMIRADAGFQRAGIDIAKGKICSQADSFEWVNGNGETVLGMNSQGDAEFCGTVRAKNFYHNVCVDGRETYGYLTQGFKDYYEGTEDWEQWLSRFVVGNYYTAEQISELSNGKIDSGLQATGIIACTYDADVVLVPNRYNNSTDRNIAFPRAADFAGKIIEVIDCAYTDGDVMGNINITAVDGGRFANGVWSSGIMPTGKTDDVVIAGDEARYYSMQEFATGHSEWCWVRIE